jgi:protein SCO1
MRWILPILSCCLIVSLGSCALRETAATSGPVSTLNGMPAIFRNVGIDQKLNHQIPLDLVFRDSTGADVRLQRYFGQRPVILVLVYYSCPMLCTLVLNNLVHSLKEVMFNLGQQYEVVTVSFDPTETPELAAAKKAIYVSIYNRPGAAAGWHFLTGKETSIRQLTGAVGFHYQYDPQIQQYIHATGIMVLTPQGRLARYFYGVRYPAEDLRLALVQASDGKIGSPVDKLRLYCSDYDPETGKYSLLISRVLKLSALLTILGIAALIIGLSVSTTQRDARVGRGQI